MRINREVLKQVVSNKFFWPVVSIIGLAILFGVSSEFREQIPNILLALVVLSIIGIIRWDHQRHERLQAAGLRPKNEQCLSIQLVNATMKLIILVGSLCVLFFAALAKSSTRRSSRNRDWYR
jgi:MFS superfamily sulfate permease-like transporter